MEDRKYLSYYFIIILLCFAIPVIFTKPFKVKETKAEVKPIEKTEVYDYKKYNKIKVLHTKTNTVEEIPLDEYLYGVVSAEMPASFEKEALKAQAVVARTYTIHKIINGGNKVHENADICDSSKCCQAWIAKEDRLARWDDLKKNEYWDKIVNAVNETKGKIILYNGEPINAFFHSNSGGNTEPPVNVWGGQRISIFTIS